MGMQWNEPDICNHINQGCGADVMAVARVSCYNKWKQNNMTGKLISTVHDSLVADVPEEEIMKAAHIFNEVYRDLPLNISKCYKVNWTLPLICETTYGPTMADEMEIILDANAN